MTRHDQQILFTAFAFLAVLLKDGVAEENDSAKIKSLAKLFETFCIDNVPSPLLGTGSPAADADISGIDAALERHIKELRDNEQTFLPEDKDALGKLYERLQIYKVRRINGQLFESITNEKPLLLFILLPVLALKSWRNIFATLSMTI